jgi:hypothetical protein
MHHRTTPEIPSASSAYSGPGLTNFVHQINDNNEEVEKPDKVPLRDTGVHNVTRLNQPRSAGQPT